MTTAPLTTSPRTSGARDAVGVLSSARAARLRVEAAQVQLIMDAVEWAVLNPPVLGRDAARWDIARAAGAEPAREDLSAEGVPWVDRAAVAELGLALGCSTASAQALVGDGLELAYRLPHLWARVLAGEVTVWQARRVAQSTRPLGGLGAAFVDRNVASVAHRVSGPQLERLVRTALLRFDPSIVRELDAQRADQRGFDVLLDQTTETGLTPVAGALETPDALDVEAAIAHAAEQLAAWGSADSRDARRARALGDLARQHLAWHGGQLDPEGEPLTDGAAGGSRAAGVASGSGQIPASGVAAASAMEPESGMVPASGPGAEGQQAHARRVAPRRQVVLYVHLTDHAFLTRTTSDGSAGAGGSTVGRVENTGTPITAETIRTWCGDTRTTLSVRPVLDLGTEIQTDRYEIPARLREQIRLRHGTCVFPGCHAPGLRCQDDHIDPYQHDDPTTGGQTTTSNLALLCQRHHTLKTHHGFRYRLLPSGAVLWRTPRGLTIRRERDGTITAVVLPEGEPRSRGAEQRIEPGSGSERDRSRGPGGPPGPSGPPDP